MCVLLLILCPLYNFCRATKFRHLFAIQMMSYRYGEAEEKENEQNERTNKKIRQQRHLQRSMAMIMMIKKTATIKRRHHQVGIRKNNNTFTFETQLLMKCIQTPLCASKNGDSKITHTFAHLLNAHIHLFGITVRISPNAIPISQPDFFVGFFSGDFLSHSMFRTSEVIQCM